jgi:hypothetical protein
MAGLCLTANIKERPQSLNSYTLSPASYFCFNFFAEHDTMSYTILLRFFVKIAIQEGQALAAYRKETDCGSVYLR